MILYVNGDSHTAAAEAVNSYAFAEDDFKFIHLGRRPHPANLEVSWGQQLADLLGARFTCDAESAGSNKRIIRTTRDWISKQSQSSLIDALVILQWSTWEREEWQDTDGTWYQVNASGIDIVPKHMQDRYRQFVINVNWNKCTAMAHSEIWAFHQELAQQNIKHIFFNGNNDFSKINNKFDWGDSYIGPYDSTQTYNSLLKSNDHLTICPDSWHFGENAHCFWAKHMLQYIVDNKLI